MTINYRLSPKATWPDHLVDCKRALAWVKDHIAEYGGDPALHRRQRGIGRRPSLRACSALTAGDPAFQPGFEDADTSVDACVPFYGVYDMTAGRGTSRYDKGLMTLLERRVFKRRYEDDPGRLRAGVAAPPGQRRGPAFFVVHGTNDTLVPVAEARRFVEALRAVSPLAGPLRRASLHPARLRRPALGPQRPRRGRRGPLPRGDPPPGRGPGPPADPATSAGRTRRPPFS